MSRLAVVALVLTLAALWPTAGRGLAQIETTSTVGVATAPRSASPVGVARGGRAHPVRPLTRVAVGGREAASERIVVGFHSGVGQLEREDAHRRARGRGL